MNQMIFIRLLYCNDNVQRVFLDTRRKDVKVEIVMFICTCTQLKVIQLMTGIYKIHFICKSRVFYLQKTVEE